MRRVPVCGFLMGVPLTDIVAWKEIDKMRDGIVTLVTGAIEPTQVMRGLRKVRSYPGCIGKVRVFVYYCPEAAAKERNKLTQIIIKDLEFAVRKHPARMWRNREVQKYLEMLSSKRNSTVITVRIRT